jgi:hypothetical protein
MATYHTRLWPEAVPGLNSFYAVAAFKNQGNFSHAAHKKKDWDPEGAPQLRLMFIKDTKNNFDNNNDATAQRYFRYFYGSRLKASAVPY